MRWYEHSLRVLRDVDEARASVGASLAVQGSLVISAPITLTSVLVAPRLPALLRAHPRLTIDLRLEDRLADLLDDAVDVAIRGGVPPPDTAGVIAHPFLQFERDLVAAPAYLARRGAPAEPEHLARHDALVQLGSTGPLSRWRLFRGDDERIVDVRGPIRATAPLTLRELALEALGIANLPRWLVEDDLRAGRLVRVLDGWRSAPVTAWVLHRIELRGSSKVRALIDALRAPAAPQAASARSR